MQAMSATLKLERSAEHLEALEAEVTRFIETQPIRIRRVLENGGKDHVLVQDRCDSPPERIGLLIGDTVHNLRAALDHTVFDLARTGAESCGTEMTEAQEKALQFPVTTSDESFERELKRGRLNYVVPGAIDYIRSIQPYHHNFSENPRHKVHHALKLATDLDNIDKHRQIQTTVTATWITITNWPAVAFQEGSRVLDTLAKSWELGRYVFDEPQLEADVEIRWDPQVTFPALGTFWGVCHDLGTVSKAINHHVAALSEWL